MKSNFSIWWVFMFLFCCSCQQQDDIHYHWRVLKIGDDPAWEVPEYDDSDWDKSGHTLEKGVFWVRFKIQLKEEHQRILHKGLHLISLGSYEAYWDGNLIGTNGKVGKTRAAEIPGTFISYLPLSDSLSQPGIHTLALRVSNWNHTFGVSWNTFYINDYQSIIRDTLLLTAFMYLLAGIYLIVAIYYFFLFLNQKKERAVFIFSLLCFLLFLLILMEYMKFSYLYPYPFHFFRLQIIGLLTFVISFLTPLFFLHYFSIPKRKNYAYLIFALLLLIYIYFVPGYDYTAQNLSSIMLLSCILVVGFALYRKQKGSQLILIVLLLIVFLNFILEFQVIAFLFHYDVSLFVSFSILIVGMLYLLANRMKEQRKAYENSLLLSARLKNELLKKNIQPHFIMNTLTSLIDWVEESPKEGVKFMEALAREFELFNQIADKSLIPIEQEIELCRKHLEIMSYRKEVQYEWKEESIDKNENIPPAILHTIIENGITHSLPNEEGKIRFVLQFEKVPNSKTYTLSTFAENRKKTIKSNRKSTGLNYIKSRLEESYGENWAFTSHETEQGWASKITIFST